MTPPFLLFSTEQNRYLYDPETSSVHPWNSPLSSSFASDLYSTSTDQDFSEVCQVYDIPVHLREYLNAWRIRTSAFQTRVSRFHTPSFSTVKKGPVWMSDLVLNVSNACNLRCSYCAYSSYYPSYRQHNKSLMSIDVARKAIDAFFSYNFSDEELLSYPDRRLNIVFYGGEPLINFPVISDSIIYAIANKQNIWDVAFSVSTNLLLLKTNHIRFFTEHGVFLNVSLDGPRLQHNRYRKLPNDNGTYDVVMDRLAAIRQFDPEYFRNKVRVLPTITGASNLPRVCRFFDRKISTGELPPILTVNFLKDFDNCAFHNDYPFDKNLFKKRSAFLLDKYKKSKISGHRFLQGDFLFHYIDDSLSRLSQRIQSVGGLDNEWYTGTCLPGRKLFITPDGRIHVCERINDYFPIGDVLQGIDADRAQRLLHTYFESTPNCGDCWARNLCQMCFAATAEDGHFDFPKRCDVFKTLMKSQLQLLYSIRECSPRAFEGEITREKGRSYTAEC